MFASVRAFFYIYFIDVHLSIKRPAKYVSWPGNQRTDARFSSPLSCSEETGQARPSDGQDSVAVVRCLSPAISLSLSLSGVFTWRQLVS